ncbi:MAG TPA: DUF3098 domain-containing protein [Edaphocola sp.]|nr:DUF3098 domain-containing protein [Edaphocola sp.]
MAVNKKHNPAKAQQIFQFNKENYIIMAIGLFLILLGFILMSGGRSSDPNVYSPDINNFRRITLAPIIVLLGFVVEVYAILKKPKVKS